LDGSDDTLVGVLNSGTATLTSLPISSSSPTPIFTLDGDGLCGAKTANRPHGCPFGGTGYEGPGTSFTPVDPNNGTVDFGNGGLGPGASAYFSLGGVATASSILAPRYVALGDSYSSGEGAPPFTGATNTANDRCHRSTKAYPELILHRAGVPPSVELWACSGAEMSDFYNSQQKTVELAQLNHLRGAAGAPTLVTLGVGGNDINVKAVAETCTSVPVIFIVQLNPSFRPNCGGVLDANGAESKRIDALTTGIDEPPTNQAFSLPQLYKDVRAAAPLARVFVVGYPRVLPAAPSQDCVAQILKEDGTGVSFGPFNIDFNIAKRDVEWMNKVLIRLDATIEMDALNAGLYYVDTEDAFAGHDVCGGQPWAHGLTVDSSLAPSGFSYHPNAQGQAAMAGRVATAIASGGSTITVLPRQSVVAQSLTVAPGQLQLVVQSAWLGSDVQLTLVSPRGEVYDRATQDRGTIHHVQRNSETLAVPRPEPGKWTVKLFGASLPTTGELVRVDSTQVPVTVDAPIAMIGLTRDRGVTPQALQFDGRNSSAISGASIAAYRWDFGDGTPPVSGAVVSHVFRAAGLHTVSLAVTDSAGLTDTGHQDVLLTATDQPPTARFMWGRPASSKPRAVRMDASGSWDVDGEVARYSWDFGDGTTGKGVAPSHTYRRSGKYRVILTVIDDGGRQGSACELVTAGTRIPSSPEPCTAPGPSSSA
jgi:chitodextrinase/lysophospholipase L1-like esterase